MILELMILENRTINTRKTCVKIDRKSIVYEWSFLLLVNKLHSYLKNCFEGFDQTFCHNGKFQES